MDKEDSPNNTHTPKLSVVTELPNNKHILNDIPNVLRSIADCMEEGKYGDVKASLLILENAEGEIEMFGGGKADYRYAFSLLALATMTHMNK